jgi:hypothetical protein
MRKKVNKSALIKDLYAANPTWKATEIVAQLKKDGHTVSLPLVYQAIRGNTAKKATTGKKRGPKPKTNSSVPVTSTNTLDLFASMQNFVNAAGSLEKAIAILNVFSK